MRNSILLVVFFLSHLALSQSLINLNSSDVPFEIVISEIESQTGSTFFYEEQWVDSIVVSIRESNAELPSVLKVLEDQTGMYYFEMDNQIIVTHKSRIIDKPRILNDFVDSRTQSVQEGLIFSREYLTDQENNSKRVVEIGNKDLLIAGGNSTVAGIVRESASGNPIEGALVYVEDPFTSAATDENGFYSLRIPNGKNKLLVQFVGMHPTTRNLVLFSDGSLNISMEVEVIALQEVMISANAEQNVESVQMGVERINIESVKEVPVLLGEKDILKVATTLPGVQQVGEGAAGFNVRGGKSDQNLFMINRSPIYNTSHFFGFFSVFNSDVIQNMQLYRSDIPAQYGGRLSSVFDIEIKQANNQEFHGKGSLSPITSALTLEIPIWKEKTSLLVGGRTTYSNWILQQSRNDQFRENRVSFNDFVLQLDHQANENNLITATAYRSSDQFRLISDTLFSFSDFRYINENLSLNWTHRFGSNLESVQYLTYSGYEYDLSFDLSPPNAFRQDFGLEQVRGGTELTYFLGDHHTLKGGAELNRYSIQAGSKEPVGNESFVESVSVDQEQGMELALFLSDEYQLTDRFSVYSGIRYNYFASLGPRTSFEYEPGQPKNSTTLVDSTRFLRGQIIESYHGPSVRISGRYVLDGNNSIKLGYSRTQQFIHTLTNSASLSPTDIWRLSSEHIRPQKADNFSLGYFRNFFGNQLETSIVGYYRDLTDLLDFKVGAEFLLNPTIERAVLQGNGRSYGLEFAIKKAGDLNGWINYTWSRTLIRLNGDSPEETINNGSYYPTNYDRPHTLNVVTNYRLTRRYSLSLNANYTTGRPVTYPVATYDFRGTENIHFSDRNTFRIPDYFRMDIGLNVEGNHKIKKLAHSFWSFSIYNVLGRDNPYSVFFDLQEGEVNAFQLIIFGNPIPTIGYNFRF